MNEKLTKIEEVIRWVCPELTIPPDVGYLWGDTVTTPTLVRKNEDGLWKTVGADIHLEHLLRAIEEKHTGVYYIESGGGIVSNNCLFRDTIVDYDLTEPLHLQSDEFISWLYGVLVGE